MVFLCKILQKLLTYFVSGHIFIPAASLLFVLRLSFSLHRQAVTKPYLAINFSGHFRVVFQETLDVFPALADSFSFIGIPGAALFNNFLPHGQIEKVAHL